MTRHSAAHSGAVFELAPYCKKVDFQIKENVRSHANSVDNYQYAELFAGCGMTVDAWAVWCATPCCCGCCCCGAAVIWFGDLGECELVDICIDVGSSVEADDDKADVAKFSCWLLRAMEDECTLANCLHHTTTKCQEKLCFRKYHVEGHISSGKKYVHLMLNDDAGIVAIDDCFGCRHYCYYCCCFVK